MNDMVLYWDASALLSVLITDVHSRTAQKFAQKRGIHFISTLCFAEVGAVINRMKREGLLTNILYQSVLEVLEEGPWRKITMQPDWKIIKDLSVKYSLRGADLWHLAVTKTLQGELPEIKILTFDDKLLVASKGENFSAKIS